MPIVMDKILTEYAHYAFETARLRRNGVHPSYERLSAEMLAELEAAGNVMRYVNSHGRIAWNDLLPNFPPVIS